uniref:Uncharacterized protein n=1 Tax=Strigamia maritima TaxID=126957 RepID=T1IX70_STRMM
VKSGFDADNLKTTEFLFLFSFWFNFILLYFLYNYMRSDYALLSTELFLLWLLTTMRCYNNCSFYIIPAENDKGTEHLLVFVFSAAALQFVAFAALVCAIIMETAMICWIWLIITILFSIVDLISLILRFVTECIQIQNNESKCADMWSARGLRLI